MADEFIFPPVETDPDALLARVTTRLQAVFPGWEAQPASLDYWLAESFAQVAASIADGASDVPPAIFRYFGARLVGLPPVDASPAVGQTTWTAFDTKGPYTIPEGTFVAFNQQLFSTIGSHTIPAGSSSVTGVIVVAVDAGEEGNGLTGTGQLVDVLDFVLGVELEVATFGGEEAESDADYLDRLAEELRLMSPRPILASDFATLARRVPFISRATALDNYKPGPPYDAAPAASNVERCVTVAVANEEGLPVFDDDKATVRLLLEGMRETNFLVYVIDPTYTTVPVNVGISILPGFDPELAKTQVRTAVEDFLRPSSWGRPTFGHAGDDWTNEPKVRYNDVIAVVKGVAAVRHVESLSLNGQAAGVDVTLAGAVPLPKPGTVGVTVV